MAEGLGIHLEKPRFSDLQLECQGVVFDVHRSIIIPQSHVMDSACSGNFEEAMSAHIQVTITDPDTLWQMLQYIYKGRYDLEWERPRTPARNEKADSWRARAGSTSEGESAPNVDGVGQSKSDSTESSDSDSEPHVSRGNQELIQHAKIFLLADYYMVEGLVEQAYHRFHAKTSSGCFEMAGFLDVMTTVCVDVPPAACRLQDSVSQLIAEGARDILQDEEMTESIVRFPQMTRAIMVASLEKVDSVNSKFDDMRHKWEVATAMLTNLDSVAGNNCASCGRDFIVTYDPDVSYLSCMCGNFIGW